MWQFLWTWTSQHWPLSFYVLRSAPFVAYACVSRRVGWGVRVALASVFAGLLALAVHAGNGEELRAMPVLFAYFLAGACLVHAMQRALPRAAIQRGAVLAVAALIFVVLPAALVHGAASAVMILLGWDLMLSSHSYCVDTTASGARPPLSEALFFLLVNPALVYSNRGVSIGAPRLRLTAVLRIALGAACVLGRDLSLRVLGMVPWLRGGPGDAHASALETYARFCAVQLVLVVGLYAAHSGLASFQIGWMRVLGVRLPERYRYPLLATSPRDFWARWNTWVGGWAQRYVFRPLAHVLVRHGRGRTSGAAVAAVATFVVVGLLHDFAADAGQWNQRHPSASLRFTALFLVFAILYAAWDAVARGVRRARSAPVVRARTLVAWAACVQLICALGWLGMPVVRSQVFPVVVERWVARLAPAGAAPTAEVRGGRLSAR